MQIAYTSGIKSTDISGASKRELLVEDINGDGLTDFLLGPKKNDYWIEMKNALVVNVVAVEVRLLMIR